MKKFSIPIQIRMWGEVEVCAQTLEEAITVLRSKTENESIQCENFEYIKNSLAIWNDKDEPADALARKLVRDFGETDKLIGIEINLPSTEG